MQHSVDGRRWSDIGTVPAAGNGNEGYSYSYVHATSAKGDNVYRILQTDKDGKSSYSGVKVVRLNGSAAAHVLYNCISNNRIQVQLEKPAFVTLYSQDGKLLWQKQLADGVQTVDVNGLAKGIYLLKTGDRTERVKVQ